MVHADGVHHAGLKALPQGFAVFGRTERHGHVAVAVEFQQAAVVNQQVVDVHIARYVYALRTCGLYKLERLAAANLFEMHRHLEEPRHLENPEGGHGLCHARDALHAERIGIAALVHKPVMTQGIVERHKEEALARHGTVFHREAQEARARAILVAVAKANDTALRKFHHLGKVLAQVVLAECAEEGNRETELRAYLLDSRKLQRIVNRIRAALVEPAVKAAATHRVHAVLEGVNIIAQRFLKIKPKAKERRERECTAAIHDLGPFRGLARPVTVNQAHLCRLFKFSVHKRTNVVQNHITHSHDLQPKDRAPPYGRPRR